MKYPLGMALTITALIFAPFIAPIDCQAAQTKSKTKKASNWPQWYYFDQLGLQQWNQRKKDDAKRTLTKAYRLAEMSLSGRKDLDPVTKRRLKRLLEHQLFLISYFKPPREAVLANLKPKERQAQVFEYRIDHNNNNIKLIERVKKSFIKFFGNDGRKTNEYNSLIAHQRIAIIKYKAQIENLRGWPRRSYDNGGRYSTGYYHIKKDGTTVNTGNKPTEDALRRNDPTFNRNEWHKKNSPEKNKRGSYYRGLRPTLYHRPPEFYTGKKANQKEVQQKYRNSNINPYGKSKTSGAAKKKPGEKRATTWGTPQPRGNDVRQDQPARGSTWGQGPSRKKGSNPAPWGTQRQKKYVPKVDEPNNKLED